MYKYTTPTFTLTLPEGTDLGLASEVVCTLAHDGKEVASKTGDDLVIDGNIVEVFKLTYPTGYPAIFDI